jgi:prepilin-type N-terminal cleavage/methylation domain-containing protein
VLSLPSLLSRLSSPPSIGRPAFGEEAGFTLIELVVVILILGILSAIAIPSYISLQDRADKSAASANIRALSTDVEAYYADNGTFSGISLTALKNYDTTIDLSHPIAQIASASSGSSFTMCSKSNSWYAYKDGPADTIHTTSTAPTGCTL